jgi:glucosyl-dolichyl phosphate glucuronosyltransferase
VVTVAICTWNRARSLERTLERLVAVAGGDRDWELLVVDNGCTDDTADVVRSFAGRLPVTHLVEPVQGLSRARNRAVAAASGDHILWTDDDVLVGDGWLDAYRSAFERHAGAAFFGGEVRPRFDATPPAWLLRAWDAVSVHYAVRKCPPEPQPVRHDYVPFGANLAIRLDVQRRYPYDDRLGRQGNRLYSGEEYAVLASMLDDGWSGWWVPDAPVEHCIPADRLTVDYVAEVIRREAEVGVAGLPAGGFRLLGRPAWLWRKRLRAEVGYAVHRVVSPPETWIHHLREVSMRRGHFVAFGRR